MDPSGEESSDVLFVMDMSSIGLMNGRFIPYVQTLATAQHKRVALTAVPANGTTDVFVAQSSLHDLGCPRNINFQVCNKDSRSPIQQLGQVFSATLTVGCVLYIPWVHTEGVGDTKDSPIELLRSGDYMSLVASVSEDGRAVPGHMSMSRETCMHKAVTVSALALYLGGESSDCKLPCYSQLLINSNKQVWINTKNLMSGPEKIITWGKADEILWHMREMGEYKSCTDITKEDKEAVKEEEDQRGTGSQTKQETTLDDDLRDIMHEHIYDEIRVHVVSGGDVFPTESMTFPASNDLPYVPKSAMLSKFPSVPICHPNPQPESPKPYTPKSAEGITSDASSSAKTPWFPKYLMTAESPMFFISPNPGDVNSKDANSHSSETDTYDHDGDDDDDSMSEFSMSSMTSGDSDDVVTNSPGLFHRQSRENNEDVLKYTKEENEGEENVGEEENQLSCDIEENVEEVCFDQSRVNYEEEENEGQEENREDRGDESQPSCDSDNNVEEASNNQPYNVIDLKCLDVCVMGVPREITIDDSFDHRDAKSDAAAGDANTNLDVDDAKLKDFCIRNDADFDDAISNSSSEGVEIHSRKAITISQLDLANEIFNKMSKSMKSRYNSRFMDTNCKNVDAPIFFARTEPEKDPLFNVSQNATLNGTGGTAHTRENKAWSVTATNACLLKSEEESDVNLKKTEEETDVNLRKVEEEIDFTSRKSKESNVNPRKWEEESDASPRKIEEENNVCLTKSEEDSDGNSMKSDVHSGKSEDESNVHPRKMDEESGVKAKKSEDESTVHRRKRERKISVNAKKKEESDVHPSKSEERDINPRNMEDSIDFNLWKRIKESCVTPKKRKRERNYNLRKKETESNFNLRRLKKLSYYQYYLRTEETYEEERNVEDDVPFLQCTAKSLDEFILVAIKLCIIFVMGYIAANLIVTSTQ